jgi:nucleoside-specific outer membrane channel protein Tsx
MTKEIRSSKSEAGQIIRALLCLSVLLITSCTQAAHVDEPAIQTFLNRYFSTWSTKDMDGYGSCFHPTARITFVQNGGQAGSQGLTDFLHGQKLGHESSPVPMTEVPTSMKISGDGRIAQAEVRWKLTKGRDVITGTDYFTLIKTAEGWKIAALVFYND